MTLETLLAGPILRRTDLGRVIVWVATAEPASVTADVFAIDAGGPGKYELQKVGTGEAETARLGPRLFIHLIGAIPEGDSFPVDRLLAYDIVVRPEDGAPKNLRDLGLVSGPNSVTYGDLPLPTFFIRKETPTLHVLHGSCRLLHGKGEDSLIAADEIIERYALNARACR